MRKLILLGLMISVLFSVAFCLRAATKFGLAVGRLQAHDSTGATTGTVACCTLTHEQQLELQVRQKDAMLAQRDLTAAQAEFNRRLADLNQEAETIRKANGWPTTVHFDPNSVSFSESKSDPAASSKK